MSDSCEHGKAKNIFQFVKLHEHSVHAALTFEVDGVEYEINLFSVLESIHEKIELESYDLAKQLIEGFATMLYDSAVETALDVDNLHAEIEEFLKRSSKDEDSE